MKTLLLLLSCVALASSSFAQTAGQFELRRFNSGGGMTSFWVTPENSKAFGLNGSGVPAMIAVGGSSTLAGLSDVAMSSLANIDLLRYDLASGKWVNATIASLGLVTTGDLSGYLTTSAASSAYQPLAEALTTLSSATAAGLALMDDANAAAQRTTLGLGTAATATLATSVASNAVPTIQVGGSPDRAITGVASSGKVVFSTPTGTGSPVWAVSPSLQGSPTIGAGSGSFSSLKFYDSNGGTGDNYIGLRAPNDVTSDMTFILPATDGTSGQALTTNGSGTLSFATVGVSDGDYGSVTVGGSGTTITIDSGAVTDSMLAGSISPSKVTGTAIVGAVGTADNAIVRADGTGGSTAQGSVATITDAGAPTFYDSLTLLKTGESDSSTLEVANDPANAAVRALFILPPSAGGRVYFGKAGRAPYSISFAGVSVIESVPAMSVGNGITIGEASNIFASRGSGGLELGANDPTDHGIDFFHRNSYGTAVIGERVANIHRTDGISVYGLHTSRTNYEAVRTQWDGARYVVKPVAGSGGGTVRAVRYYTTATVWFGSGSGTPESVETAGIGSLYTDTATGTVYRKTSGTGNTGWVTP